MASLDSEKLSKVKLSQAREELVKELARKNYIVLESNESYDGIPKTIILGGEIGRNHKADFHELAERLGLQFMSGEYYVKS